MEMTVGKKHGELESQKKKEGATRNTERKEKMDRAENEIDSRKTLKMENRTRATNRFAS
jgi:hypothetical protein